MCWTHKVGVTIRNEPKPQIIKTENKRLKTKKGLPTMYKYKLDNPTGILQN